MITIIDYDAGNLRSVEKALLYIGEDVMVSADHERIRSSSKVILPGVGSFQDAMDKLRTAGLDDTIREVVERGVPFLGICLGMQLMYNHSEEGNVPGLGILSGEIRRFPDNLGLKIPQIGWNSLDRLNGPSILLQNTQEAPFVYFVHSYYVDAADVTSVKATTHYGITPHVLVEKDNIFLTQFHPEKSGETGLQMLRNFAAL